MGNICNKAPAQSDFQRDPYPKKQRRFSISNLSNDMPHHSFAKSATVPPISQRFKEIMKQNNDIQEEDISGSRLGPYYLIKRFLVYEGQWKEGVPNGKGKVYFDNGAYFYGYFLDGEAQCREGFFIYPDGSYYRGNIKNSKIEGVGTFVSSNGSAVYKGYWKQNKPHGFGQQKFADGNRYEGKFQNGYKHGDGVFYWGDDSIYKGTFKLGYMWGQGSYKKGNSYYDGKFQKNAKTSKQGVMKTEFGTYQGPFANGKMNGNGKFFWNDKKIYTGQFQDGQLHGEGCLQYPNGQKVYGLWKQGENVKITKIQN